MAAIVEASGGGDAMVTEEEEKLCRFCFDEEEEGNELISPCRCKGGQKWIHLGCLRKWQRMTIISQPTHPSFWNDDERHHQVSKRA